MKDLVIQNGAACGACGESAGELFPFTMAFQPIVDLAAKRVFAYEALVRGPQNEGAYSVLQQVTEQNRYAFDQTCRTKAIALAAKLGVPAEGALLSMNFMPGAVYSPSACIQRTLRSAREHAFPLRSLIFEITEDERVQDPAHLKAIIAEYKKHGFLIAMDDFGAGYSGLNLLAELAVDIVKLDGKMTRAVHEDRRKQAIVRSVAKLCEELGSVVVGEAIETAEECRALEDCGVTKMQGYYFARPLFEGLPPVTGL